MCAFSVSSLCFKKMTLLNLQWICAFQIMSKPTPKCHWLANISTVFFVSTTARLYELIFSANGCLYEHQTWSVPSVSSILICTDSRRLSHILSGKGECFTKVSGRQMHRCSEPKPPVSAQHCCVLIRAEVKGTDKENEFEWVGCGIGLREVRNVLHNEGSEDR